MTNIEITNPKDVILVVDDQPINLKVIASVLSQEYSLSIANNGVNALKMLEKGLPDLILLDIMMPEMDGFEVCRQIKQNERTKDIPVIFLTAKTDIKDIIKGFDYGAVDYIFKPFNPTEMKVRILNHLNLYHAKNELKQMYQQLLVSQEALKNANQQLEQSNNEKDKFFSIIAHDLRSPFTGFLGLTKMMADDVSAMSLADIQEVAVGMRDSASNLFRLLENLLEWSQMEQGMLPFNPEMAPLRPIVSESVTMVLESAKSKGIEISYDIPADLVIFADIKILETIIRNLVSNALKFTPQGGLIFISASVNAENLVEISVKDTGIGMDADILDNLFRIDARTGREGTEGELSTGLGLILCKEFVEKHEGSIWAESEEGKGSTFYFTVKPIGCL
jgi:signal transduction histidine kinase